MSVFKADIHLIDRSMFFVDKNAIFQDLFLGLLASNIEIQVKTKGKTPKKTGQLRRSVYSAKLGQNHYAVFSSADYALAQERGYEDRGGKRIVFKNYTTDGTGPGWFKSAVDDTRDRQNEFARIAAKHAGVQ